jgi:ribulose-5-phosphate 4-epimerase/fuculose-1-phosphate aldolase
LLDKGILEESDASLRPPTFATVEEERAHRKARLVGAYRLFNKLGYEHWVAGHISVRDPGHEDRFWVNPLGTSWRLIRPDDLVCVDFDGNVVTDLGGPDVPVNGAAFAIHSQIHLARPGIHAVAHAHTPCGRAWAATGRPLEAVSQDHCAFHGDHGVLDAYTGAVYDAVDADPFARALGGGKALILKHHGLLTVGETVDEAAFWLHLLERCCQTMLLVAALAPRPDGRPGYDVLDDDTAAATRKQVGEPLHGWRGFQPLYAELCAEQPDLAR